MQSFISSLSFQKRNNPRWPKPATIQQYTTQLRLKIAFITDVTWIVFTTQELTNWKKIFETNVKLNNISFQILIPQQVFLDMIDQKKNLSKFFLKYYHVLLSKK